MEAVTQQLLQPVIQFMIIGRRIQRHSKLAQESGIVNALMRFAIRWDKTGAVDGKNYILPQQIYVVDDLIIGTLQEGGINAYHRQHALTCKPGSKGHSVLLCHTDIKKTLRVAVRKKLQAGAILHCCSDGADIRVPVAFRHKSIAKYRRERFLWCHLRVGHSIQIKCRHAVIVAGVYLGRLIALALFCDHVQKMWPLPVADGAQCAFQLFHVVAIHRPDVLEAHILEHGRVVHCPTQKRLALGDVFFQWSAHQRYSIQKAAHIILGIKIGRGRAQMSQIAGKCTDIFRNGHLVVVQDHKKVVQLFNVVHALVDHAAGKGTIADHRDHKPCFMMQLFGPRHADRKRKRRVSVPGNECIVFALVRVRETGDPVELAQLIKLSAPTRKDLVCVALVTDIKHDFVLWCIQNTVQRNGKLYHAKV